MDQAADQQVDTIISLGTNLVSSQQTLTIAKDYPQVVAAVGIHPSELSPLPEASTLQTDMIVKQLTTLVTQPRVVAIGEIGLDYHYLPSDPDQVSMLKQRQRDLLTCQLQIAVDRQLPVILHNRDSHQDLWICLDRHLSQLPPAKGIMHCFAGPTDHLHSSLQAGFYISFAGNLTFKNAQDLRKLITQVPLDRLLLETDSPYLGPAGHRRFPNVPANVVYVYQQAAELLQISVDQLALQVHHNLRQLFHLLE
jgi:TatD DNase family protein